MRQTHCETKTCSKSSLGPNWQIFSVKWGGIGINAALTNSWGIHPEESLSCCCSSKASQRPLPFPLSPSRPHPDALWRLSMIGACSYCCCWIMDGGRGGESQGHQDGGSSAVRERVSLLGEGLSHVLSSVSPWILHTHHTATFVATCVHRCVCLLNGRKSDEPIVGRSVCCLGWSDGDRMSQSTFPTSASCAFVCSWNSEGDQLEQTSQHMAAAAFLFFLIDVFIDILILCSKATSAVWYMKSWRLECNSNSYGWNVGKRIISNRFLSNTVLFLTNMQRLNALFSS